MNGNKLNGNKLNGNKLNGNKLNVYYNGSLYKQFDSMAECDKYFNYSRGFTFSALRHILYRMRVNKYKVLFTNVSTIENANLI